MRLPSCRELRHSAEITTEMRQRNPLSGRVAGRSSGESLLEGKPVHVADVSADPEYTLTRGRRSSAAFAPCSACRCCGRVMPIGVIASAAQDGAAVHRQADRAGRRTFADQAVIAIENVRLFDEVQARTRELTESLEQQTATSEVLQVITSSPGELEPVFEAMLENATRICEAKFGAMYPLTTADAFRAGCAAQCAACVGRRCDSASRSFVPCPDPRLGQRGGDQADCSHCRRSGRSRPTRMIRPASPSLELGGARTMLACRCSRRAS